MQQVPESLQALGLRPHSSLPLPAAKKLGVSLGMATSCINHSQPGGVHQPPPANLFWSWGPAGRTRACAHFCSGGRSRNSGVRFSSAL